MSTPCSDARPRGNANNQPIYAQLDAQIKALILSGALQEGDLLPSIRNLAKDLRISVITTKRACDEWEKDGCPCSVAGKGSYVAGQNTELIRETHLKKIKAHIKAICQLASGGRLSPRDEERWLREQHKRGLRLVKITPPCFYVFEECTPEDVMYRLDYQNRAIPRDYQQMFQDYGWEYVGSCLGWLYFRKPASEIQQVNDGEIFSDPESRVDMIHHILKTRMLPLLVILLGGILPNIVAAISGALGSARLLFTVAFTLLLILYLYLLIYCGRKLARIRRRYRRE